MVKDQSSYTHSDNLVFGNYSKKILFSFFKFKWNLIYYCYLKPFKSSEVESKFLYSEKLITDMKKKLESKKNKKTTMYILGSGYSINDISTYEWNKISETGYTFSFNNFFRGEFVPIDFHLLKDVQYGSMLYRKTRDRLEYDMGLMVSNKYFKNTNYFIHVDKNNIVKPAYLSIRGCTYLYFLTNLFNSIRNKIGFYSHSHSYLPTNSIRKIPHVHDKVNTLFELTNIAYLMGFKKIVYVGLDLYDFRYFWQDIPFKKGKHDISDSTLTTLNVWSSYLVKIGVKLYVYNNKSLAANIIPVFNFK